MKQKGFTLIELMVIIAIISLLSTIVMAATNTFRQKARVAKRVADLHQIQKSLELYFADNGNYPNTWATSGTSTQSTGLAAWG